MSGEPLSPLELAAWRGFLRTHSELVRVLDADLRNEHGFGLSAYEMLGLLDDAPGSRLRPGEQAAGALLTPSGITRVCDRLVRDGLVVRESFEDDGRGSLVVLTAAGRRRVRVARATHLAGVRACFLTHLGDEEVGTLSSVFTRLSSEPSPS